ncbi:uncharacterized protein cubi_00767 [Cryptosporidium ubiquitum]|uniref:MIF4G domain-containing protein n=1 Tax=Cryptosporidium ubiquitum TaxID=857276 RepID=A0A1J4MEV6_9CRYT|nr:uncharacterized protein cubi_00767 [Cryptosporidium ubiquitum]OII71389.1 hypothetical protein cubi_00767 [Cryptosporidium ubiquitum]
MVAEKQQERHNNDKKRKFRRPFQRSPTNGALKSSIGKEKDKVHNRYISTNANTGGGFNGSQANGNVGKNFKDANEGSSEIVNNNSGSNNNINNNESRLNNNRYVNNSNGSNKNFSNNNGGVKNQYYGTRRDSSEKGQFSTGTNINTYVTGNDDNSKPSHAKNNKPEKIHQNQQQHQQQNQHQSNQHSKQVNQRQTTSNYQQKHQVYSSSSHNSHHEGRYNQDRRGRGYGYSSSRQHNQGGPSGGSYDLNRKQLPPPNSNGNAGGSSHGSKIRPNQHNKSQQFQSGPPSAGGIAENTSNTNTKIAVTATTTNSTSTAVSVPNVVSTNNTTSTTTVDSTNPNVAVTTKEEGGKHYSSQNNSGISTSRKDFHGITNRRGGDSHYHGHSKQQSVRDNSNYNQHKDNAGKGGLHGSHQKDNEVPNKELRATSHKGFISGKPGGAAMISDSEQKPAANLESRQKIQPQTQQQAQQQTQTESQKLPNSQQVTSQNFGAEHRGTAKGDSSIQKGRTEHNQNPSATTTNYNNQHSNHHGNQHSHHNHHHGNNYHFSNNSGGASWKGQSGAVHTHARHGRYSGPKNVGKGPNAYNGGTGQNLAFSKQPTEGGGNHSFTHNTTGNTISEDLKKKKGKKRFNKNVRNLSGVNGSQINGHQIGGNNKERGKYGSGEQLRTHGGEGFSATLPDENEPKNISNKIQSGAPQYTSGTEIIPEKGKVTEHKKKFSGSLNESDNIGTGKSTTTSGSANGKSASQELEKTLDRNSGKSTDCNANNAVVANGDMMGIEKVEPKTTRDSERKEKIGSLTPAPETKEGDANNISSVNNTSTANSGSSSSSGSSNSSSSSGVVGPWRRNLHGGQAVDSLETVRRTVKSLLNKITVEKFTVIAEKLAVCIDEIKNVDELEELVKQVLDKAITEPDFSEMYADLCQILKWRSPSLVSRDGKSTIGFSRALLARCEQEFKNMPRSMTPTEEEREKYDSEELVILYRKRKLHVLGIIRLIGELFIRKMFPMRSLNELVFDLVMIQENPDEYAIECLCQLIMTTGYYLDSNEKSQMIVDQWFGRLKELQNTSISTRLNCLIQDVFDLRKHKWVKKVHKQKAKALADILKDIDVEDVLGGAAIAAQYGSVVVVGERSNLVGNSAYYNYMTSQEELYISKQKSLQKQ